MRISIVLCLLTLLVFMGCQESNVPNAIHSDSDVIAGVWQAQGSQKAVEIDEQGKLVSFTNVAGLKISIAEGGISQVGRHGEGMLYLILGETPVEFDPLRRILKITINFDDYRMEVPGGSVSGKLTEVLEGGVSADGKSWMVTSSTSGSIDTLPIADDTETERYLFQKVD